jgi:hypothetical protein
MPAEIACHGEIDARQTDQRLVNSKPETTTASNRINIRIYINI